MYGASDARIADILYGENVARDSVNLLKEVMMRRGKAFPTWTGRIPPRPFLRPLKDVEGEIIDSPGLHKIDQLDYARLEMRVLGFDESAGDDVTVRFDAVQKRIDATVTLRLPGELTVDVPPKTFTRDGVINTKDVT